MLDKLLEKIAFRLEGMNWDDCTTAERQIANLLIEAKYLRKDENKDLIAIKMTPGKWGLNQS